MEDNCKTSNKANDKGNDITSDKHSDKSGDKAWMGGNDCCCRTKIRNELEYKDLISRLNRIEGQIRGVKKMVEDDRYCIDIITQVAAAGAALNSLNKVLMSNHIKSCVVNDIKDGSDEKLNELVATLQKLMR